MRAGGTAGAHGASAGPEVRHAPQQQPATLQSRAAAAAAASQLAGLRRRAAIKRAAAQREQQTGADGVREHSAAVSGDRAAADGSMHRRHAGDGEHSPDLVPEVAHAAALKHSMAEAPDIWPASGSVEQGHGRAAVQPAVQPASPAPADSQIRLQPALAAKEDPLQCVREFLAEVRARSASNNIVAATLCSLRAHLSERQRYAGRPVLSPGGASAPWVPAAAGAGGGVRRNRHGSQQPHSSVPRMHACRTEISGAWPAAAAAPRATADGASSAPGIAAGAGAGGGSDAEGPLLAARDERLVSQLAGLKRRAAIKHTSA